MKFRNPYKPFFIQEVQRLKRIEKEKGKVSPTRIFYSICPDSQLSSNEILILKNKIYNVRKGLTPHFDILEVWAKLLGQTIEKPQELIEA